MDLQGELNRLAQIPLSERMRGMAYCANVWAGTTGYELVGALNAKLGRAVNGTCLELNGVLKQLGFDLDSNGALVGVDTAGVVGGGGAGVQNVLRLPGLVGNFVSTPDTAALSISGDIDLRAKAALDNWLLPTSGSGSQTFISKENPSNQRSYSFSVTSGILFLRVSVDGTTASTSTSSSASVSFAPGQTGWVRATWRQSDGRVQFFTSTDGVTYTQLGIDRTIAVASIFDGTGLLTLGTRGDTGQNDIWGGYLYYAEVRSGIGGPVVAKFDSTTVAVRGDRLPTTHTQPSTAEAIRLPGVAGNYISQPDSALNSVTGDIDLRAKCSADDWTPAGTTYIIGKEVVGARSYCLGITSAGKIEFRYSVDGTNALGVTSSVAYGFTDGSTNWIRATRVAATDAINFYTSSDGATWTPLGTPQVALGALGNIADTTPALELGSRVSGTANIWVGALYYAEVRNGINGTVVASFDAARTQPTAQQLPTTQDLWTINGTAWSWDVPITEPSSGALRLPGVAGNYVSAPDAADISIVGDIDLRCKVALDDWTPAATQTLIAKRTASGNLRSYRLSVNIAGTVFIGLSADGITEVTAASSVATGVTDGATKWIRATWALIGGLANFYTSDDGVTWTLLGAANQSLVAAGIADTTAPLEIGTHGTGATEPLAGYVYRAEVYNGIAGTLVAYFDAQNAPTDTNRTPTTVVQSGRTWTLNGALWEWVNVPAPTSWTVNGTAWYWGTYSGTTRFLNALQLDPQYVVFDGTAGNYASTPDSAALSITGDIDVRIKLAPDNWLGVSSTLIGKWVNGGQRSWKLVLLSTGLLQLFISADGTALTGAGFSAVLPFTAGSTGWVRVTRIQATGVVAYYTSLDGVTWTAAGTTTASAGQALLDTTSPVEVGSDNNGVTNLFIGKIYYTEIRNGIGGAVAGAFRPHSVRIAAVRNPTTHTGGASETWTMNGSAWSYSPTVSALITTPDSAALSITGDLDLRAKITIPDAVLTQPFIAKRTGISGGYQLRTTAAAGGPTLELVWGDGAASQFRNAQSGFPLPGAVGSTIWVRAVLDVDNGAAGNDTKFYTSTDGVVWTQLGLTQTTAGVTQIGDSTDALEIGSIPTSTIHYAGTVYYAEVRNGIAGTVVGSFDPQKIRYTGSDTTPTTVPSATGETYTISGSGWHWIQV